MEQLEMQFVLEKNPHEAEALNVVLQVLYVIEGKLTVRSDGEKRELGKDDMMILSVGSLVSIRCTEETILARAKYTAQMLKDVLGEESNLPLHGVKIERQQNLFLHKELKEVFAELIYDEIKRSNRSVCMQLSLLLRLMALLAEDFFPACAARTVGEVQDVRLQKMVNYVLTNYQENIGLSDLAEQMYVSVSTLSRLFKKGTGMQFTDYVNQVRMQSAVWDLVRTDKNIVKIAMDSGYSNLSTFNRVFKEMYGVSPSEYRQSEAAKTRQEEMEESLRMQQLRRELETQIDLPAPRSAMQKNMRKITADVRTGRHFKRSWNLLVNGGSATSMTLANLQYHIQVLKENLDFEYLRIWNLFSTNLMAQDGVNIGRYNYDKIDAVLDFVVSNRIKPFLDLGQRPDTAILKEGHTIYFEEEYLEFASRAKWEDLMRDFIAHLLKRYGKEEVSSWIFEISRASTHTNDTPFYHDPAYSFDHVYNFLYDQLRAAVPEAKIGGPVSVPFNRTYLREFLVQRKNEGRTPDFMPFLLFPYSDYLEEGVHKYQRNSAPDTELTAIRQMKDILEEAQVDCELYAVEFNISLSNRNYLNDSCSRAAYTVDRVQKIGEEVDMIGIWMASDWISNYYDTPSVVCGGVGILTKDSIRKPAYYAWVFLKKLGPVMVEKGENYIITRREQNSYYILCYNYKPYSAAYYLRDEVYDSPDELDACFVDHEDIEMKFRLQNMPSDSTYIIKKRCINDDEGAVLGEWKRFQYAKELRHSDTKYIRESCIPGMSMKKRVPVNGTLSFDLTLKAHEIALLHVYEDA